MITLYKLTDGAGKTHNGTQWGPGVSHSGTGKGELWRLVDTRLRAPAYRRAAESDPCELPKPTAVGGGR